MNNHKVAIQYNVFNALVVISCILITIINGLMFGIAYLFTGAIGFFIPIVIGIFLIMHNKKKLKNYISDQNKELLLANNVKYIKEKKLGKLPASVWDFAPKKKGPHCKIEFMTKLKSEGHLQDIDVRYTVEHINYTVKDSSNIEDIKYLYSLYADAIVSRTTDMKFGDKQITFVSDNIQFENMYLVHPHKVKVAGGTIYHYNNDNANQLVIEAITNNPNLFNNDNQVMAFFINNMFVYISDNEHDFKLDIPFIINGIELDRLINNQKRQVYEFNKLLTNISRITS